MTNYKEETKSTITSKCRDATSLHENEKLRAHQLTRCFIKPRVSTESSELHTNQLTETQSIDELGRNEAGDAHIYKKVCV